VRLEEYPTEPIAGMKVWRNAKNGFTSALLHFSADPSGPNEDERRKGMDEQAYNREHDLSFDSWAGKPVYPMFQESRHVDEGCFISNDFPVIRCWDFGYHRPAVVYWQAHGGMWVHGELLGQDMTLMEFFESHVAPYEKALFGDRKPKFIDAADIAGRQMSDKSEHTSFAILSNYGVFPFSKKTEINEGLTIIRHHMNMGTFKVHPRCRILIEGLKGGYRYPEPTPGLPEPMFPQKDGFYDHLMDALRYGAVNVLSVYKPRAKKNEAEQYPPLVERLMRKREQHDPDLGLY
jgi:hypothetical protein